MDWTKEPPTKEGWYWMQLPPTFLQVEKKPYLECLYVCIRNGVLSFDIPCDGYECENDFEPEDVLYWMGPLEIPSMPEEK